ncbi:MAG: glycerol-3-phosphate dehydrogenase subunit GlpB [Micrococcales bacterium]|nr:glycerol-3-phosphate dehydrogenase subunit GlpB [Micrococcales bacterium]
MNDVVVIGAGLAGLTSAIRAAEAGAQVALIARGMGGLGLSQGTIDILGYAPHRVDRPLEAMVEYVAAHPDHPYAAIGPAAVSRGVAWLTKTVGPDLLTGDPSTNKLLPTAIGAARPTAVFQPSMAAGDLSQGRTMAIVGFAQLKDFSPELCAANLARTMTAHPYRVNLAPRAGADCSALVYARSMDEPAFQRQVAAAVGKVIGDEQVVGLPAMLGLADHNVWRVLSEEIGREVFEIPLIPPSVPGLRLSQELFSRARAAGVRIILGSPAVGAVLEKRRVRAVIVHMAGRDQEIEGRWFCHAPGGFESGALAMDSRGHISETVFDLPLRGSGAQLTGDDGADQPLFAAGLAVDEGMRVVDLAGDVVYDNLLAAGSVLAGAIAWSEKSGEGIALGSAIRAVETIEGEA